MQSKQNESLSARTIPRSLASEVTVSLMIFIALAITYFTVEGLTVTGWEVEMVPVMVWAVLSVLCWMQYRVAFLVAAIFGALGTAIVFATSTSFIQYSVMANYLVIPFSLRAYREMRLQAKS